MGLVPAVSGDLQALLGSVGLALSDWERMEEALSTLYTVLIDDAGSLVKYADYGGEGRIFAMRADLIEQTSSAYFAKGGRCDQDAEGAVASVVKEARSLSAIRNLIAHGMVQKVTDTIALGEDDWEDVAEYYVLAAPWFSEKRLGAKWPGLSAQEIIACADEFRALCRRIEDLVRRLCLMSAEKVTTVTV